jgi:hypothetical protein
MTTANTENKIMDCTIRSTVWCSRKLVSKIEVAYYSSRLSRRLYPIFSGNHEEQFFHKFA